MPCVTPSPPRRSRSTCTCPGVCANARTATSTRTRCARRCRKPSTSPRWSATWKRRRRTCAAARSSACSSAAARRACFRRKRSARVLEAARRHLSFAADCEITLEANPGTVERGRFTGYREAGRKPRVAGRAELRCAPAREARPHSLARRNARAQPRSCTPPASPTSTST